MALNEEDQKIRDQVRAVDLFENLDRFPGLDGGRRMLSDDFWKQKIKTSRELVDKYGAVGVPGCVRQECVVRVTGWLVDRWTARQSVGDQSQPVSHLSALRHSGAAALLSPWKVRRGGAC